jgi:hypothetical protein
MRQVLQLEAGASALKVFEACAWVRKLLAVVDRHLVPIPDENADIFPRNELVHAPRPKK